MSVLTRFAPALVLLALAAPAAAQETGALAGTVTRADDGSTLQGVGVQVRGTGLQIVTGRDGGFSFSRVPAGSQVLVVRWIGFRPKEVTVTVQANATIQVDIALDPAPVALSDILVTGASRGPERVVEAPAAVVVVDAQSATALSPTGQVPLALAGLPGVDVVQSGVTDFNINTRGLNSSLNRRVLVLLDGRDLSIPFLGSQEWSALSVPLEDLGRMEMVRGPGSALYGANAYSGVLNISTPFARDVRGLKASIAGGELGTMRADLRGAEVFGDGRFGVRFNAGYYKSDTWTRSRTGAGDLQREYAEAVDTTEIPVVPPSPGFEVVPLNGQSSPGLGQPSTGEREDIRNIYGSARLDHYAPSGAVLTLEGGAARVENEVLVTGIGRVQVIQALRPWARAAWASNRFFAMAWYSGRNGQEPQVSLASGRPIEDKSSAFHGEVQGNWDLFAGRGRVVVGASARTVSVNTEQTLMYATDDDRSDEYYSAFGQVEYNLGPRVRLIGAARVDESDLYDTQFSPRGALVYSPNDMHSFRLTVNRAFQTPSILEYFLRVPVAAPANFYPLEQGLRASPLGPALAQVPDSQLFTRSNSVPILALGNNSLDVEKVTSFELGYKGQVSSRLFFTIEGFYNRATDFVTDLLPAINPAYGAWTAPPEVPAQFRPAVEQAVRDQLAAAGQTLAAAGLTRIVGDSTAVVVSYGNAGEADEYGVEVGAGFQLTNALSVEASYTWFDFSLDASSVATGDRVLPNTPQHKGSVILSYRGREGLDVRLSGRFTSAHDWAAGVFVGEIPATQTVDLSIGYQATDWLRISGVATNLLDQQRYQVFGGSVIGRRVIAGVTTTF